MYISSNAGIMIRSIGLIAIQLDWIAVEKKGDVGKRRNTSREQGT